MDLLMLAVLAYCIGFYGGIVWSDYVAWKIESQAIDDRIKELEDRYSD